MRKWYSPQPNDRDESASFSSNERVMKHEPLWYGQLSWGYDPQRAPYPEEDGRKEEDEGAPFAPGFRPQETETVEFNAAYERYINEAERGAA